MSDKIIDLVKVGKVYLDAQGKKHKALDSMDLQVTRGEFISIIGPSGCGKTTLAQIIGLLSTPSAGEVYLLNQLCSKLNDNQLTKLRGLHIGYVFQDYVLIDHLSVLQNVMLAYHMRKLPERMIRKQATDLLVELGLGQHISKRPNQLSGGQKQRVAIARTLIKSPSLILADEPVGALDPESRILVLNRLKQINSLGTTIIMVTHNQEDSKWGTRLIRMDKGKLASDQKVVPDI